MANIRLPQARSSAAPRTSKQYDNGDMIMKVMGTNPYAQAIDQVTPILAAALQKRQELRKQAQQVGQVETAYGMDPGKLQGLPLAQATTIGKDIFDQQSKQSMAGKKTEGGGYFIPRGVDPATGRPVYSDSKKIGLFFDDNTPYKGGAPGALNLKAQPSDQLQKESDLSTLKFALDKVKGSYDPELVGPIASRYGKGKQYIEGAATPEATDFYSNAADMRNQLVYLRSGKQINEEEYARLKSAIPNEEMSPTDFSRRMTNFEQLLDTMQRARSQALAGSGYRNPNQGALSKFPAKPAGTGETPAQRKARLLQELSGAR